MPVTVVLCGTCGSHLVDVKCWQTTTTAVLRCAACSHESPVIGFTVGRVYQGNESGMVAEAIEDAAVPLSVQSQA